MNKWPYHDWSEASTKGSAAVVRPTHVQRSEPELGTGLGLRQRTVIRTFPSNHQHFVWLLSWDIWHFEPSVDSTSAETQICTCTHLSFCRPKWIRHLHLLSLALSPPDPWKPSSYPSTAPPAPERWTLRAVILTRPGELVHSQAAAGRKQRGRRRWRKMCTLSPMYCPLK